MKTVEDTRRELFQSWYDSLPWPMCEKCSKDEHIAWQGFNAALDLLVIEMPFPCNGSLEMHGKCIDAITSTNLGIKIK